MKHPPGVIAASDHNHAVLAGIVDYVRDHMAICPGVDCCGTEVFEQIRVSSRDKVELVLELALCELARRPAPATLEEL